MKKDFADTLKEMRVNAGYSQKEVYEMFNIRQSTFSAWETGRAEPSADMLLKLCKLYNVNDILGAFGFDGYNEDGSPKLNIKEIDVIEKYRFVSIHSPDGASVVNTVLDREYAIAEKLKAQEDSKDRTAPPSAAEIIPMRFLSYYQRMASAGKGEFLFPDIPTEVIPVPDTPLSRRADFVIGVSGRSMEDTFFDGDKVLVEKADEVPIGKIGIFVRGNECFIKEAGQNRLISHNGDKEQYPDIVPDERGIDAIGIVLGKVGE
jgi:repressor LexA|nr:LexA family transcriptional regulator [uncultured Acetatifactor sp.]